jgi:hypothetical protein
MVLAILFELIKLATVNYKKDQLELAATLGWASESPQENVHV